ncbi:antirepressor [Gordonia phage Getalong]|uniref:Antirepressor n=4 Tax=Getalongvirus TaxID=2733156 RepID=A0A3S9UPY0_9CAUD|nr:Rha-like transcriptional regulator [Gordonia phage Getalong]YP_009818672.1 Rha-like transcriptional regulator [Gordonia phage Kenna]YP_009819101.1 Rha-like transcriptional regulator [Gordonia phage Asapag]QCG77218.1 antirepressor [Gordonia phage Lutum]AYD83919.1 antirepressor [Gordonia phage Getalong]AZS12332.1 antirepressor [Gordonia phage Kenna]QAU07199.1 antirepressor [Gordonia phage Asapag]
MTNDITPLVTPRDDGEPTTTSLVIAEGTGNQHKNVLELVRNNIADFEEFGGVAFQTRPRPEAQHGGGNVVIAILNEAQATLLLTYMRNNDIVRAFKKRLVHAFIELRRAQQPQFPVPQSLPEALRAYAQELEAREAAESYARELEPKAEYVDRFVSPDDCILFRTVANQLNMSESLLRELLVEKRWIYKTLIGKRFSKKHNRVVEEWEWRCYADKKQWFRLIAQHKAPRHHNNQVRQTLYVTPPGENAIRRLVGTAVDA